MVKSLVVRVLQQTRLSLKHAARTAFSSKYLLVTNLTICATMSGSADGFVQRLCKNKGCQKSMSGDDAQIIGTFDGKRLFRMSTVGTVTGCMSHYWYLFLDRKFPGNTFKIVVKKTLFDQICFGPVYVLVFFLVLGLLECAPSEKIIFELKKKGPELVLVDWLVYPPAQYINFRFLPTRFRILYDNAIAFCLDLYYSHLKYER
ncbi:mpv17-like protein 2 [Watersipora subatra]|uniref:mpv17-like protein 2 n=1 Tax=Watersipora subatra TaxID=2589382 RepID=UPI00355C5074